MITAIVTSDNHLGTNYARFRPDTLERRRQQLQSGFQQVVDAAIAQKADMFLHAGDLYDTPVPRNAERKFVAQQFQRLQDAGIPVFCIAGNHDSPRSYGYDGGVVPLEEMSEVRAAHLFRRTDRWEPITLNINGVTVGIRGLSSNFSLPSENCPLGNCVEAAERCGDIDLVLLHYGVEKWGDYPGEPCLSLANLEKLAADAICVGHLHTPNKMRLRNGAVLLNPGATEHIRFGEEHLDCGYWVLRCEPGRVESEYVEIATQPMRTLDFDMAVLPADTDSPPALHDYIINGIEAASKSDLLLRVRLTGKINRRRLPELDIAALQECGQKLNLHFQIETDDLVLYDETTDAFIEIGFNFDVPNELRRVVESLRVLYTDDPTFLDVHYEAGEAIQAAYLRLSGGKS